MVQTSTDDHRVKHKVLMLEVGDGGGCSEKSWGLNMIKIHGNCIHVRST